jgi:hypothetical protein
LGESYPNGFNRIEAVADGSGSTLTCPSPSKKLLSEKATTRYKSAINIEIMMTKKLINKST